MLPSLLKEIVKAKGIPLGKDVSIAPDVGFGFRNNKPKSIGVTIHFA